LPIAAEPFGFSAAALAAPAAPWLAEAEAGPALVPTAPRLGLAPGFFDAGVIGVLLSLAQPITHAREPIINAFRI
jgi:hypothetical protein